MKIGQCTFKLDRKNAYIMGILNVTPDSFSDGGKWNSISQAVDHAAQMIRDGADIIDVGGESTRPGHIQISTDEECSRIIPVIDALKERFQTPISVDCYRYETAKEAITHGADLINDIWGLLYDNRMAKLIADSDVAYCLMHNRTNTDYHHLFFQELILDFSRQLTLAKESGIKMQRIILDPGIGFAKNREQEAYLIHHLDRLSCFELPLLLGTSRKRLLGSILDIPTAERDVGTAATTVYGFMKGAAFFRVHDVLINRQALDVAIALERKGYGLH